MRTPIIILLVCLQLIPPIITQSPSTEAQPGTPSQSPTSNQTSPTPSSSPSQPSPTQLRAEAGQVDHSWLQRSSAQCLDQCGENRTCYEVCLRSGLMMGLIIGLFGLVILTILGLCICYRRHMCLFWKCHKYQTLKKDFNKVNPGKTSQKQFIELCNKIVQNFDSSIHSKNHFHTIGDKYYKIKAEAYLEEESPFCTKLTMEGSDNYSKFKANGYIVCRNGGEIFVWFYKIYKDKTRAGQVGSHEHLIYESVNVDSDGYIVGKWYYLGDEENGNAWQLRSSHYIGSSAESEKVINSQPTSAGLSIGRSPSQSS